MKQQEWGLQTKIADDNVTESSSISEGHGGFWKPLCPWREEEDAGLGASVR
jgi:hypothetical protein